MSNFIKEVLKIILGKKTITKFTVGDYNIRFVIMPGVNNPGELNRERLDAALKEAMDNVLIELAAKKAAQKRTNKS